MVNSKRELCFRKEADVKRRIREELNKYKDKGIKVRMPKPDIYGGSGDPDYRVEYLGVALVIETKYDCRAFRANHANRTGGPTMLQRKSLVETNRAGGVGLLVDAHLIPEFWEFMKEFNEMESPTGVKLQEVAKRLGLLYVEDHI